MRNCMLTRIQQGGLLQQLACRLSTAAHECSSSNSNSRLPALTAMFHSSGGSCTVMSTPCCSSAASSSNGGSTSPGHTHLTNTQLESVAIFRRFNIAQPHLQGQVILAKVLRTTPRQYLVDSGYYGLNWISRQELAAATGFDKNGRAIQRSSPEVCPGDYVKVRLSYFNTPYGDPQLDAVGVPHEVRQKLVWQELAYRMSKGLQVKGRILNPTVKGYAVAVAGYVALLPHDVHKNVQPEQLRQIGVLQDFYVHKMDEQHRRITLSFRNPRSERDMEELYKASMPQAQ